MNKRILLVLALVLGLVLFSGVAEVYADAPDVDAEVILHGERFNSRFSVFDPDEKYVVSADEKIGVFRINFDDTKDFDNIVGISLNVTDSQFIEYIEIWDSSNSDTIDGVAHLFSTGNLIDYPSIGNSILLSGNYDADSLAIDFNSDSYYWVVIRVHADAPSGAEFSLELIENLVVGTVGYDYTGNLGDTVDTMLSTGAPDTFVVGGETIALSTINITGDTVVSFVVDNDSPATSKDVVSITSNNRTFTLQNKEEAPDMWAFAINPETGGLVITAIITDTASGVIYNIEDVVEATLYFYHTDVSRLHDPVADSTAISGVITSRDDTTTCLATFTFTEAQRASIEERYLSFRIVAKDAHFENVNIVEGELVIKREKVTGFYYTTDYKFNDDLWSQKQANNVARGDSVSWTRHSGDTNIDGVSEHIWRAGDSITVTINLSTLDGATPPSNFVENSAHIILDLSNLYDELGINDTSVITVYDTSPNNVNIARDGIYRYTFYLPVTNKELNVKSRYPRGLGDINISESIFGFSIVDNAGNISDTKYISYNEIQRTQDARPEYITLNPVDVSEVEFVGTNIFDRVTGEVKDSPIEYGDTLQLVIEVPGFGTKVAAPAGEAYSVYKDTFVFEIDVPEITQDNDRCTFYVNPENSEQLIFEILISDSVTVDSIPFTLYIFDIYGLRSATLTDTIDVRIESTDPIKNFTPDYYEFRLLTINTSDTVRIGDTIELAAVYFADNDSRDYVDTIFVDLSKFGGDTELQVLALTDTGYIDGRHRYSIAFTIKTRPDTNLPLLSDSTNVQVPVIVWSTERYREEDSTGNILNQLDDHDAIDNAELDGEATLSDIFISGLNNNFQIGDSFILNLEFVGQITNTIETITADLSQFGMSAAAPVVDTDDDGIWSVNINITEAVDTTTMIDSPANADVTRIELSIITKADYNETTFFITLPPLASLSDDIDVDTRIDNVRPNPVRDLVVFFNGVNEIKAEWRIPENDITGAHDVHVFEIWIDTGFGPVMVDDSIGWDALLYTYNSDERFENATVKVVAIDEVGNRSDTRTASTLGVAEGPNCKIELPLAGSRFNIANGGQVRWSVVDDGVHNELNNVEIDKIQFVVFADSFNVSGWQNPAGDTLNLKAIIDNATAAGANEFEGTIQLRAQARTSDGLMGLLSDTVEIFVDFKAPEVVDTTTISIDNDVIVDTMILIQSDVDNKRINVDVFDRQGIKSVGFYIRNIGSNNIRQLGDTILGNSVEEVNAQSDAVSFSNFNETSFIYVIDIVVYDSNGNKTEATSSQFKILDTIAPIINISAIADEPIQSNVPIVVGREPAVNLDADATTYEDYNHDWVYYHYVLTKNGLDTTIVATVHKEGQTAANFSTMELSGNYEMRIWAYDSSDNRYVSPTVSFFVKTTPPTNVSATILDDTYVYEVDTGNFVIGSVSNDDNIKFRVAVSLEDWIDSDYAKTYVYYRDVRLQDIPGNYIHLATGDSNAYEQEWTIDTTDLKNGFTYELRFYGEDIYGNRHLYSEPFTKLNVTIDTQPPVVILTSITDGERTFNRPFNTEVTRLLAGNDATFTVRTTDTPVKITGIVGKSEADFEFDNTEGNYHYYKATITLPELYADSPASKISITGLDNVNNKVEFEENFRILGQDEYAVTLSIQDGLQYCTVAGVDTYYIRTPDTDNPLILLPDAASIARAKLRTTNNADTVGINFLATVGALSAVDYDEPFALAIIDDLAHNTGFRVHARLNAQPESCSDKTLTYKSVWFHVLNTLPAAEIIRLADNVVPNVVGGVNQAIRTSQNYEIEFKMTGNHPIPYTLAVAEYRRADGQWIKIGETEAIADNDTALITWDNTFLNKNDTFSLRVTVYDALGNKNNDHTLELKVFGADAPKAVIRAVDLESNMLVVSINNVSDYVAIKYRAVADTPGEWITYNHSGYDRTNLTPEGLLGTLYQEFATNLYRVPFSLPAGNYEVSAVASISSAQGAGQTQNDGEYIWTISVDEDGFVSSVAGDAELNDALAREVAFDFQFNNRNDTLTLDITTVSEANRIDDNEAKVTLIIVEDDTIKNISSANVNIHNFSDSFTIQGNRHFNNGQDANAITMEPFAKLGAKVYAYITVTVNNKVYVKQIRLIDNEVLTITDGGSATYVDQLDTNYQVTVSAAPGVLKVNDALLARFSDEVPVNLDGGTADPVIRAGLTRVGKLVSLNFANNNDFNGWVKVRMYYRRQDALDLGVNTKSLRPAVWDNASQKWSFDGIRPADGRDYIEANEQYNYVEFEVNHFSTFALFGHQLPLSVSAHVYADYSAGEIAVPAAYNEAKEKFYTDSTPVLKIDVRDGLSGLENTSLRVWIKRDNYQDTESIVERILVLDNSGQNQNNSVYLDNYVSAHTIDFLQNGQSAIIIVEFTEKAFTDAGDCFIEFEIKNKLNERVRKESMVFYRDITPPTTSYSSDQQAPDGNNYIRAINPVVKLDISDAKAGFAITPNLRARLSIRENVQGVNENSRDEEDWTVSSDVMTFEDGTLTIPFNYEIPETYQIAGGRIDVINNVRVELINLTDRVGNAPVENPKFHFVVDRTPPTITQVNSEGNNLRFKIDDDKSGVKSVIYAYSNDDEEVSVTPNSFGIISIPSAAAAELMIKATDYAGNSTVLTTDQVSALIALSITRAVPAPNPVVGNAVNIMYNLSKVANDVTISIFDFAGNRVRTIEGTSAITNSVTWNLTNDSGKQVANGVYFAKIEASTTSEIEYKVIKIAIVR